MIQFKKHTQIALSFFLAAATLGLLLRYASVFPTDFSFRYVVHAHSHIAVMGWLHFALATLICYFFLIPNIPAKTYKKIFGAMLFSVVGMLASFPFQGYAFFSIFFSSLFLITSYFYTWAFFKYSPNVIKKKSPSYIVIKYALIFMVTSSIGPWSIGAVMATIGQDPFWYNITIYFYLHFQYNAWILLGILGVFLRIMENHGVTFNLKDFKYFIIMFNASAIFTFFLSVLFADPVHEFYVLSIFGSFLQFIAFFTFIKFVNSNKKEIREVFGPIATRLLYWAVILFFCKIVMQYLGSFPYPAKLITFNHNLAIGFLHWVFLGVASFSTLALLFKTKLIYLNKRSTSLYIFGFFLTEAIIFYKPIARLFDLTIIPYYNEFLLIASLVLFIPIAYFVYLQITKKGINYLKEFK